MALSIRGRLAVFSAVGGLLALTQGVASWWGANALADAMTDTSVSGLAIRNHLEGDMMHDALRGDVLAALLAQTDEDRAVVHADLAEHAENFRARVAANRELDLDPESRAALDAVGPALEQYIVAAERLVALAERDPASALAQYGEFKKPFEELEERNGQVSDLLVAAMQNVEAEGQRAKLFSQRMILASCGLVVAMLLFASQLVTRSIVGPLAQIEAVLARIAKGDLTARFEPRARA